MFRPKLKKLALALGNTSGGGSYESLIRSLSPAAWYMSGVGITGSLTVSNWADQSGNTGRDLAQATGGNQPIYLPYSGTAYGYLPGVASNTFSTPDSVASSVTSNPSVRLVIAPNDWTPAAYQVYASKDNSGQRAWIFGSNTDSSGTLIFQYTTDGSTIKTATSSVGTGFTDATFGGIRADLNTATGDVTFYTSTDNGESWSVLGTVQSTAAGAVFDSNQPITVGDNPWGGNVWPGKVSRFQLYSGSTLAVDFNPATFAETSTNGATAVASTGETWTLNSTGAKPAQIVKSASLLFDGTDDYLQTAGFTLNQPTSVYIVFKSNAYTDNDRLFDGAAENSGSVYQSGSNSTYNSYAGGTVGAVSLALSTKGIITVVFNGASGVLQSNANTAATGNIGAGNMGGIQLAGGTASGQYAAIQAYELIAFPAAHDAAQRAMVISALNRKFGIF